LGIPVDPEVKITYAVASQTPLIPIETATGAEAKEAKEAKDCTAVLSTAEREGCPYKKSTLPASAMTDLRWEGSLGSKGM
jgi:hypothetical protein